MVPIASQSQQWEGGLGLDSDNDDDEYENEDEDDGSYDEFDSAAESDPKKITSVK